jgi:DnaK suppressor protein
MSQIQSSKAKSGKDTKSTTTKPTLKAVKAVAPIATAPAQITITAELIQECRSKLIQFRTDLLNQVKESRSELTADDKGGDEADQTVRVLAEAEFVNRQERLRNQLMEIDAALGRIENGSFGVCEETEEGIEPERLRAIPWTRLSIEGAEIRESMNKRFAR